MSDILVIILLCIIITLLAVHILPMDILFYIMVGITVLFLAVCLYHLGIQFIADPYGCIYNLFVYNPGFGFTQEVSNATHIVLNQSLEAYP